MSATLARAGWAIETVESDPVLDAWFFTLASRTRSFTHARFQKPACWVAIRYRGEIKAACGFTVCHDRTIFIDALVCEPSKVGSKALIVFATTLANTWRHERVRFFAEMKNARMRRIAAACGCTPIALLFEKGPEHVDV